jgi:hypothetical protein
MTTYRQAKQNDQHATPWRRAISVRTLALTLGLGALLAQPAQAKVSDAEAALIGAMVGQAIGGKTTLGSNAGEIEGWMVSASLLQSAALVIKNKIEPGGGVILVGDEAPNLGLPGSIVMQMNRFDLEFSSICKAPAKTDGRMAGAALDTAFAGAISGAPKSETEWSGYINTPSDDALTDALLGVLTGSWKRLGDIGHAASSSKILSDWEKLRLTRYSKAALCEKTDAGKNVAKRFDDLDSRLTASAEDGGPSILEQAARIETALSGSNPPQILRVHIEKSGGSITNTDNFATRLGWPAVQMTGGLVLRYRLADAVTGAVINNKAGIIVCHSPRKTMGAIHRGKLPAANPSNCTPAT